jgi:hypothetical protein
VHRAARFGGATCVVLVALAGGWLEGLAQAPDAPAARRSATSGVYTAAQAREGEAIFQQHCSRCHSSQEYRSERFRAKWTSQTLAELYAFVSRAMPFDQPGSLQPVQYAELLAFMLEVNGFRPGGSALSWDQKDLAGITLDLPRP